MALEECYFHFAVFNPNDKEFIKITLQIEVALKDNSSQFSHKSSLEKNGSYKVSGPIPSTALILGEEDWLTSMETCENLSAKVIPPTRDEWSRDGFQFGTINISTNMLVCDLWAARSRMK